MNCKGVGYLALTKEKFEEIERVLSLVNQTTSLQFLEVNPEEISAEEIGFDRTGRLKAWKQLENAVGSINDIRNSRHGLRFVGVLGHFTSGKSSLINALLEIGNDETPGYKRKVGQHPTDKSITLICHQNARENLESNPITSIDQIQIEHGPPLEFLENIVLVDTPGLGNTEAEHDLAERFLHLCHVIIITVDGMVPFADTTKDFDLLDKAFNSLSGVPKIFSVTKSSNFLTDRRGEYDKDWDGNKADTFWQESINRIVSDSRFLHLKQHLTSVPLCFIDSIDQYNIDKLKNIVIPLTQDSSQQDRIFEAKVSYSVSVAVESIFVFQEHLSRRLSNLDILYSEAKRKAEAAENTIQSQFGSVTNAISTAENKLGQHESIMLNEESTSGISEPNQALLSDKYLPFANSIRMLEKSAALSEELCLQSIRNSIKSEVIQVYRILSPLTETSIQASVSDFESNISDSLDFTQLDITTSLQSYCEAGAKEVIERIKSNQESKLFFMGYDTDKPVLSEVQQSISGGLGQFIRAYNGAAEGFVAYLTQPSSRSLLAEYGLVLFGDAGEIGLQATKLELSDFPAWGKIKGIAEQAKLEIDNSVDEVKKVRNKTIEFPEFNSKETPFGSQFEIKKFCSESILLNRLERALRDLSKSCDKVLVDSIEKQKIVRTNLGNEISEIWTSRIELVLRFTFIVGLFSVASFGLRMFDQTLYISIKNLVVGDWRAIALGVVGSCIFTAASFALVGSNNKRVKKAFSIELRPILKYFSETKVNKNWTNKNIDLCFREMENSLSQTPINMTHKIHSVTNEWFQKSEILKPLKVTNDQISVLRNKRRTIFSSAKAAMLLEMASLSTEGMIVANTKRKESVDRVLALVTDKRENIVQLQHDLATSKDRLTSP